MFHLIWAILFIIKFIINKQMTVFALAFAFRIVLVVKW